MASDNLLVPEGAQLYAVQSTPVLNDVGDVVDYKTEFNNGSSEQYDRVGVKPIAKSFDPDHTDEFAAYVSDMTSCEGKKISSPISENFTEAAINAQADADLELTINE